ncbi:MAG: class III cytochrome C family protein [Burkholderiales bacterium]|nr:class III cytochrome C family protein [Burkholderiales bacterium]
MVSPGPLAREHAALATDCFACHAPLRGAAADRCVVCHALPDIGLRTTKGVAITNSKRIRASFHRELVDARCMACHTDHAGPYLAQRSRGSFSHDLLRAATREHCDTCHTAPADTLHRQLTGNCAPCHNLPAWKPATFDHDKFFRLDGDHKASCAICHSTGDYSRYTCYGCHEHTPANMKAKHREEGIGEDLDDCVRCHRSANGEREGNYGTGRDKGRREGD